VRREAYAEHVARVRGGRHGERVRLEVRVGEVANERAVGRVPDLDHARPRRAGRDQLAVGAERRAVNAVAVALLGVLRLVRLELADQVAAAGVPELEAVVVAAREHLLAVEAPGHRVNRRRPGRGVGVDLPQLLVLGDVPEAYRAVVAAGRELGAGRVQGHRID